MHWPTFLVKYIKKIAIVRRDRLTCLQIDTYETIYQDVETVEGSIIFEKWFRVDSRPFRQALLNIVKRWSLMFKQHLIDHVTNRCASSPATVSELVHVSVLHKQIPSYCFISCNYMCTVQGQK